MIGPILSETVFCHYCKNRIPEDRREELIYGYHTFCYNEIKKLSDREIKQFKCLNILIGYKQVFENWTIKDSMRYILKIIFYP